MPWQVPRRFFGIDTLPRTATGKVRTAALRDLVRDRLAGQRPAAGAEPADPAG